MSASSDDPVVSKGEFAQLSNVSPGRVTQWINEGKISGPALVGEGRSAKIRVRTAQAQLKRHLDPNQMTANGIKTRIPTGPLVEPVAPPPAAAAEPPAVRDAPAPTQRAGALLDLTEERARLAKEQADHTALKNAALRGELIDAADADRRWSNEMALLRARMLAVASDLPQLVPSLSKHDVGVIDRAIRAAMTKAADVEEPS